MFLVCKMFKNILNIIDLSKTRFENNSVREKKGANPYSWPITATVKLYGWPTSFMDAAVRLFFRSASSKNLVMVIKILLCISMVELWLKVTIQSCHVHSCKIS